MRRVGGPASASTCAAPSCPRGRIRSTRRCSTRRWRRSARSSTPRTAASAPRPSSPPRWCSSSCSATPHGPSSRQARPSAAARLRDARPHARRDGAGWPLRPARRRLRPLQRRPRLGGPALREDALRQRPAARPLRAPRWRRSATGSPARPRTSCSPSSAPHEGAFASALDADSPDASGHSREGAYYAWTPAELDAVLGDDAAWAARLLTVTDAGTFEEGASTLQLRADPDDAGRWASVRQRLLDARSGRARPARDDKVVAAWNGLAVSGLVDAGLRLDAPEYVEAAVRCASYLWDVHWVPSTGSGQATGRLRRVSRDGVVGAHAGVLEDYGCLATAYVDLAAATADPVVAGARPHPARRRGGAVRGRRRRVLRHRRRRRGARRPGRGTRPTTPARQGCRRWRTRCSATRRSPAPASTGRWRRVR